MDWGAALAGIDSELQQRIKNNAAQTNTNLDTLQTTQSIRNQKLTSERLAAQQQAQEEYWKGLVSDKQQRADAVLKDKDETNALIEAYNNAPTPEEKAAISVQLRQHKINLPSSTASAAAKPVYMLRGGVFTRAKDENGQDLAGAQIVQSQEPTTPMSPEMLAGLVAAAKVDPSIVNKVIVGRGAGTQGQRNDVWNKVFAHGSTPEDFNIAVASSDFKANQKAESDLQGIYDKQKPFHEAAKANFEILKGTLKNIPDLGNPVFNQPIRMIAGNLLDPAAQKAFEMARQSAMREYTRIIGSSPSMAGQIHQSTIDSMDQLMSNDVPFSAAVSMMEVAQKDMDNVMDNVAGQVQTIRTRMKTQSKDQGADLNTNPSATPTATGGAVANHPASVGTPVHQEFQGFPPLVAAPPGSKGHASKAAAAGLAAKFGKKPQEAKDYLIASGYVVD